MCYEYKVKPLDGFEHSETTGLAFLMIISEWTLCEEWFLGGQS
jgi:hypothetical protein